MIWVSLRAVHLDWTSSFELPVQMLSIVIAGNCASFLFKCLGFFDFFFQHVGAV
jgi:hypothetical protein